MWLRLQLRLWLRLLRMRRQLRLTNHPAGRANGASMKTTEVVIERLTTRRSDFVAWAAARLPCEADAEDVVQRAMERATAAVGQIDEVERAESWFWTILRRTLSDHLADQSRHIARVERVASLAPDPPATIEVDEGTCPCSVEEFGKLSPALREVMVRVDIQDYSAAEAADELGISAGTARVRVHRARKELRARVEDRCQILSATQCSDCSC
jgi:RNA polymerase sigma-70 factor (ECF subfamily)